MILKAGEKVHAGLLAQYEGQVRRAFIGVVEAYEHGVARIRGKSWLYDPMEGVYVPKGDERIRLVSVASGRYVINVLPPETNMENLRYHRRPDAALLLTDGEALMMDVSEGDLPRPRGPAKRGS
jgi:hypothetical protein